MRPNEVECLIECNSCKEVSTKQPGLRDVNWSFDSRSLWRLNAPPRLRVPALSFDGR